MLQKAAKIGLEIIGFGHGGMHRMIRPLVPLFQYLDFLLQLVGRAPDIIQQFLISHVVRTGRRDQQTVPFQQAHGQAIDPTIGQFALFHVLASLDKRRRIQHHDIELFTLFLQLA